MTPNRNFKRFELNFNLQCKATLDVYDKNFSPNDNSSSDTNQVPTKTSKNPLSPKRNPSSRSSSLPQVSFSRPTEVDNKSASLQLVIFFFLDVNKLCMFFVA